MLSDRLLALSVLLLSLLLAACGDADKERRLVDLFTTASQDVVSIEFPASIETVVSSGSEVVLQVEGLRPNGIDRITVSGGVEWSLSPGAVSSIEQSGRFSAGAVAETVTVTARLGVLSTAIDLRVSTALFDRVVQLNDTAFAIDMCRGRNLTPIGRYVDDQGNEEIRAVDSSIMGGILWSVENAEDGSPSQRAWIETGGGQVRLHTLAAGDLRIFATALSRFQGVDVTSDPFNQAVDSGLNSIKLCNAGDTDLNACSVTITSVEGDRSIGLIAVGNYPAGAGASVNENITATVKWGTSNPAATSNVLTVDLRQLDVTGDIETTSTTLSAACGNIEQSLAGVDVTDGVVLDVAVSCGTNPACLAASATVSVERLSVESLEVSANGINLTDDTAVTLDSRPADITLAVTANYVNATQAVITTDPELFYDIVPIDGQADVIEAQSGNAGSFNVLGAGTARIRLVYRGQSFIAEIEIP